MTSLRRVTCCLGGVALLCFALPACSGAADDAPLEDTGTDEDTGDPGTDGGGPDGTGADSGTKPDGAPTDTSPAVDTRPPDPPPIPGAVYGAKCSDLSANELVAWQEIAVIRGKASMGALDCVDTIEKAARAHSAYIIANGGGLTHTETAGKPGFTGVNFWDRMKAAGFGGSAMFEVVHSTPDAHASLLGESGWINTLYHRIPFVSYGAKSYGYGATAPGAGTIDFASGGAKAPAGAVSTWPVDGDKDVWTTFRCGSESPNPLPGQTYAGYPASLTAAGALAVTEHTITGPGGVVDHVMLTKSTDSTGLIPAEMVFLIPKAPLAKSTTYVTKIGGTNGGAAFSKTWSFTTGVK